MPQILALYKEADAAANATEALQQAGYTDKQFEILTDSPYPEGAFGEVVAKHKLYVFPFMGAILGFSVAMLLTAATQSAYPLVVGGKPILPCIAVGIEPGETALTRIPRGASSVAKTRVKAETAALLAA